MGRTSPKILMVDESALFRQAMKRLLADSEFKVIADAGTAEDAAAQLEGGPQPDLVLLSLYQHSDAAMNGLHAIRPLLSESRIVVLCDDVSAAQLTEILRAGADGCLVKDLSREALVLSLNLVLAGEKVLPTRFAGLLLSGAAEKARLPFADKVAGTLSQREIEVLKCLVEGVSNKVIARRLQLSEATVKVHIKSLLKKIEAANRTQAAVWAIENGLA